MLPMVHLCPSVILSNTPTIRTASPDALNLAY
jgi:hypothetical protein